MDTAIKLESLVNKPSEIFLIFEEWFPETKTMLMLELKDSINKIEEVNIDSNENLFHLAYAIMTHT